VESRRSLLLPQGSHLWLHDAACAIRDAWGDFERAGAVVLGVSPDDVASHERFRADFELPFTLLADLDHKVAELYGVWAEKNRYGASTWHCPLDVRDRR